MAKDKGKDDKVSGFTTTLKQGRDTKNTFVYKNETDDAPIPSLYIKKTAFKGDAPETITVTVAAG
jgi:hypothetical protein